MRRTVVRKIRLVETGSLMRVLGRNLKGGMCCRRWL